MTNYKEILKILPALLEDNLYEISILANTTALLHEYLEQINWVGFYINIDHTLFLGPFQGKIACTKIPFSKGVCGKCATSLQPILVPNVHEFEGHISCDSASNSEICIPILVHKKLYAVLDIDSPLFNRFNELDKEPLKRIAEIISAQLEKII